MVLAIIFLVVALLSAVSLIRQFKIKNYLAIVFSALATLCFGYFSVMEIICRLTDAGICP
ncbi:DUF2759 family protein [Pseudogracilibacillus sp. ICA-222130]|uniref:DUF2759 family protein n=1 Tax=Pseudogracilibacillus sp. ICA-222130 TaxID=3134655 RepID=UPI0030C63062